MMESPVRVGPFVTPGGGRYHGGGRSAGYVNIEIRHQMQGALPTLSGLLIGRLSITTFYTYQ